MQKCMCIKLVNYAKINNTTFNKINNRNPRISLSALMISVIQVSPYVLDCNLSFSKRGTRFGLPIACLANFSSLFTLD